MHLILKKFQLIKNFQIIKCFNLYFMLQTICIVVLYIYIDMYGKNVNVLKKKENYRITVWFFFCIFVNHKDSIVNCHSERFWFKSKIDAFCRCTYNLFYLKIKLVAFVNSFCLCLFFFVTQKIKIFKNVNLW